jgi:hypothetical protein
VLLELRRGIRSKTTIQSRHFPGITSFSASLQDFGSRLSYQLDGWRLIETLPGSSGYVSNSWVGEHSPITVSPWLSFGSPKSGASRTLSGRHHFWPRRGGAG